MKTKLIILSLLLLASGGAFAQHDHASHAEGKTSSQPTAMFKEAKLGVAYQHYIQVKDALVSSNAEEAKKAAIALQKSLNEVKGSTTVLEAASKFATLSDLEEQRTQFSTLSNEMATFVKGGKLSEGMLYLDYCPMANNNEGGYWLSNDKEIKNPYFGDKMLKCGGVKETIH